MTGINDSIFQDTLLQAQGRRFRHTILFHIMVYPMKKKLTAYEAAGAHPPSDYSESESRTTKEVASEDTNTTKNADVAVPLVAPSPRCLDLLFAASQVETNPKDADASDAEFPSNTITVVGNGRTGSSCDAEEASCNELDAASSDTATALPTRTRPRPSHKFCRTFLPRRSISPSLTGSPMASLSSSQTSNDSLMRFFPSTSVRHYSTASSASSTVGDFEESRAEAKEENHRLLTTTLSVKSLCCA